MNSQTADTHSGVSSRLRELALLFLRLGVTAFGGPAAHIAMMEDEVVVRRNWLSRQHFLDLVGATNLIPGPNSSEMTMHVGYERARLPGLVVAGACFILPAVVITLILAWLYVRLGQLPAVEQFLLGIKPAVIGIILGAVWRLGGKALKSWQVGVVGVAVFAAALLGVNEIVALLIGGVLGMLWLRWSVRSGGSKPPTTFRALAFIHPLKWSLQTLTASGATTAVAVGVSLWKLGLVFLLVGATLYGSGYVLFAYLQSLLVENLGWLTEAQLLDAIAIGQFTPGPVLTTATFVGYLLAGVPGAIVATVGIFLPSFIFVLILNPVVPRMRRSPWLAAFLDAVNIASIALMLVVVIELGRATLTSWPAWLIAILSVITTLFLKVNSAWVVLGGAILGFLLRPFM
jgi:chromate transporter